MSGMIGVVTLDESEWARQEASLPPAGRYFRGTAQTASVDSVAKVQVFAKGKTGAVTSADQGLLAVLGQTLSDSNRITSIATSDLASNSEGLKDLGSLFAFCFFDLESRRLYLATDVFGSFPLYYALCDGTVYFSTDLDSLSTHGAINTKISNQSIYNYLYFSIIPAPNTIYENVYRVPSGHLVIFDSGTCELRQWYSHDQRSQLSAREGVSQLRTSLEEAVESCWAGGTSACFLSGGLDSSTVSGLTSKISRPPVPAYSIGFPEADYDEIPYARAAANKFSLDHHIHYVSSAEIQNCLTTVLGAVGEPFSNASTIPAYICAQIAANDGFDNLLAGDGGDELFAGNERYSKQLKLHVFERLPSFAQSLLSSANSMFPELNVKPFRKLSSYITQASLPFSRRFNFANFIEQTGVREIFDDRFLDEIDTDWPQKLVQEIFESAPFDDFLKRMLYVDWRLTLGDNDIRKVRMACDIAGTDVQFPMLQRNVVEVSERLSGRVMMPRGKLRGLYKNAFDDFLPMSIITKPKHGFGVPVGHWMNTDESLRALVERNLSSLAERKIFKPEFVAQVKRSHKAEDAVHYGVVLWTMNALETWFQCKNV